MTLMLFLGLVGSVLLSGVPAPVQEQGSAALWLSPPPDAKGHLAVRLSEIITLKLTVQGPAPLAVKRAPEITPQAVWKILKATPPVASASQGRAQWQQTFQLLPLDQGAHPLNVAALTYRVGHGDWKTVEWKPIAVTVTTDIKRVDAGEAGDVTDIERLPPETSWWTALLWPAVGIVVVGFVGLGILLVWQRRRSRTLLSPEQAALKELDHVLALKLPEHGRAGRFAFQVSGILRRYLERRFQIPALRQTTAEFVALLEQRPLLGPTQDPMLRELLERCDLAKFAGVPPSTHECREIADAARSFLEQSDR